MSAGASAAGRLHAAAQAALNPAPADPALAERFLSRQPLPGRYVLGRNPQSAQVIARGGIDGLVDDFARGAEHWNGVPVLPADRVPDGAIVLICSSSISPVDAARRLATGGRLQVLPLHALLQAAGGTLDWPHFVTASRDEYLRQPEAWAQLAARLADEESVRTLIDVLGYRLGADPAHMHRHTVRIQAQYFEPFLPLRGGEVFVDAGGYDGDTTEQFCRRCPDYRQVLFFEPSPANMQAAKARLAAHPRIEYLPCGLSDRAGTLRFDAASGSASAVTDAGSMSIEVTTLDEAVKASAAAPVSFLKMDIEGWEQQALAGGRATITAHRPRLALAVYHHPRDFLRIPALVETMAGDCDIHLRHYTQGWSETVMYLLPRH